jgi:hypothetical protein
VTLSCPSIAHDGNDLQVADCSDQIQGSVMQVQLVFWEGKELATARPLHG